MIEQFRLFEVGGAVRVRILGPVDNGFDRRLLVRGSRIAQGPRPFGEYLVALPPLTSTRIRPSCGPLIGQFVR